MADHTLHLLSLEKIWDHARHNALVDLVFFREHWYCAFRESDAHVNGSAGTIRVISSSDSIVWRSAAQIVQEGFDLRDPKLTITPGGQLQLLVQAVVYDEEGKYRSMQSCLTFSDEGTHWCPLLPILAPHEWLWRITWHQGKAYGVSYRFSDTDNPQKEWLIKLFESHDGIHFQRVVQWNIPGNPCEATLRFAPDGQMIALLRRDKSWESTAFIGTSHPPYLVWTWRESRHFFGGPNFIELPDGRLIACGRIVAVNPYGQFAKTAVAWMTTQGLKNLFVLPSAGDNSYPGMVFRDNTLFIAYYSSHEGSTAIYLARISTDT